MTAKRSYGGEFVGKLFRHSGPGGWHFVTIPEELAPRATHAWGRTPVHATVDGVAWDTSVWKAKDGATLLAVPKRVRGGKGDGDRVTVRITFRAL